MEYDGSWQLRLPGGGGTEAASQLFDSFSSSSRPPPPPYLANGKLAILPAFGIESGVRAHKTLLVNDRNRCGNGTFGNAEETFGFMTVRLFDRIYDEPVASGTDLVTRRHVMTAAKLHMGTGTYECAYDVLIDRRVGGSTDSNKPNDSTVVETTRLGSISSEIAPLRQFPHVALQSVRLRVRDDAEIDPAEMGVFHELSAPLSTKGARFSSNTILLSENGDDDKKKNKSAYVFSATDSTMAVSSTYLWDADDDSGTSGAFTHQGFNVDTHSAASYSSATAFTRLKIETGEGRGKAVIEEDGSTSKEYRFHVLTCAMARSDTTTTTTFCGGGEGQDHAPLEETKRVLLTVMGRGLRSRPGQGDGRVHAYLRTEHARAWDVTWSTNVIVTPKLGITATESERLNKFKRHLRYALYNVYSSIRGGVDRPLNPASSSGSYVDLKGNAASEGDLWFLPCLTVLKPTAARASLDARKEELPHATQIAHAFGHKGAKFPYATNKTNGVLWDAAAVTHVFNTALVAVNAWNYYRVSQDRDWLQMTGFPVIQAVANFTASVFETDPDTGTLKLTPSAVVDGRKGAHNAFAVNACLLALKAAVEAAYVLSLGVRREWTEVLSNAHPITFQVPSTALAPVFKFDDEHVAYRGPIRIAEPLLNLTTTYSRFYLPRNAVDREETIVRNLAYYDVLLGDSGSRDVPENVLLRAHAEGVLAQLPGGDGENITEIARERTETFFARLEAFLESTAEPLWGNLDLNPARRKNNQDQASALDDLNDLNASAMLLLTVLGAAAGVRVAGGVTDTRFVYEELRTEAARNRKLPKTWRDIRVTRLGGGSSTAVVVNELAYP